ncbi:MAG: sugar phosphate isomerase/epimerase [Acidobacteriales bacterium]|nr:sugar phosphate isomerase/epimerase [Terriglobales bacterium]
MNRREFLGTSVATLASLASCQLLAGTTRPIGLQMYTVREEAERDLAAVLAALARIGYQEVELYWNLYSRPAAELRKMLADHGLRARSGHLDYDGFGGKLGYARDLGLTYVVCPMLPKKMWDSLEGFKRAADQFNAWGEQAQKMEMRFGFHNHNYEFRRFGDTTGFETMVARTDPGLVWLELDCYWVTQAGHDPVEMLNRHGNRVRMIHIKDRKPGFPPSHTLDASAEHFAEVGTGTIDWKAVLAAAQKAGVEHYFVEQDSGERPPLESVAISYRNLRPLM